MVKGITNDRLSPRPPWAWGQHFAVAAAYGALYEIARHLSFPQWMLTSGLRLAALLLLPVRYWPALAAGEGLPLLETALLCGRDLGATWIISESVPMAVLWMPLLKPLRQRWELYDTQGRVRMVLILWAALGTAMITAGATLLTAMAAIFTTPGGKWPDPTTGWQGYFLAYFLGAYLGALTLTPTILAMRERVASLGRQPLTLAAFCRSALFRDAIGWALPVFAGLTWLAVQTSATHPRQAVCLALALPTLALGWRHGWHGTAVGGMLASIALAIAAAVASPGLLADPATIQIEVVLALIITGALLVANRRPAMQAVADASMQRCR